MSPFYLTFIFLLGSYELMDTVNPHTTDIRRGQEMQYFRLQYIRSKFVDHGLDRETDVDDPLKEPTDIGSDAMLMEV
jgi:hypothetical protein